MSKKEHQEKSQYFVGAKKHLDGQIDLSKAALWSPESMQEATRQNVLSIMESLGIGNASLSHFIHRIGSAAEAAHESLLHREAKRYNVDVEHFRQIARRFSLQEIRNNEQGNLRHFHSTSLENFGNIAKDRSLLSRSKLKELHPEIKVPGWSASDNVMMNRDHFNKNGELVRPGYSATHSVGAAGQGVTLVIKESIMDRDDYQCFGRYPTISELPLEEYCEVILVDSNNAVSKVKDILREHNFNIPVQTCADWKRS